MTARRRSRVARASRPWAIGGGLFALALLGSVLPAQAASPAQSSAVTCKPASPRLLVDSNRDGKIDPATDAANRNVATPTTGALFLANLDNDKQRTFPDGLGKPDAISFDAATGQPTDTRQPTVTNARDKTELTPILVNALTVAGNETVMLKTRDPMAAMEFKKFHMFDSSYSKIWGGLEETNDTIDITSILSPDKPTTLYLEGLFFKTLAPPDAFPTKWVFDGVLKFELDILDNTTGQLIGCDRVSLQVAPFLLLDNTRPTQFLYTANDGIPNQSFRKGLKDGVGAARYREYSFTPNNNQWTQDHVTIGYTQAPGRPREKITFRLPRPPVSTWPVDPAVPGLLGPGYGVFSAGNNLGAIGAGDFGGDIELMPPTAKAKLGLIITGTGASASLKEFFQAQAVQVPGGPNAPMFPIQADTDWLRVGHVDEILNFRSDLNAPDKFRGVQASPNAAYCLLGSATDAEGNNCPLARVPAPPATAVFFAKGATAAGTVTKDSDTNTCPSPAPATQSCVLYDANTDFTKKTWGFVRIYDGTGAGQVAQITDRENGQLEIGKVWETGTKVVAAPANLTELCEFNCITDVGGVASQIGWFTPPKMDSKYVVVEGSRKWFSASDEEFPAIITVKEVLADADLRTLNAEAALRIRKAVDAVKTDSGVIFPVDKVPVIFMGSLDNTGKIKNGSASAFTPDLANLQPVDAPDRLFVPKPFGPAGAAGDVFEALTNKVLNNTTVTYLDDWNLYHRLMGSVHCGTNVVRKPFDFDWWTKL